MSDSVELVARDGLRVRLVSGEHGKDFGEWVAGRVPVGSAGTLCREQVGFRVEWDGITARPGWKFGLMVTDGEKLPGWLAPASEAAGANAA